MAQVTLVFGPAYLDRVLRVDRPLLDEAAIGPIDGSVDGSWEPGQGLVLTDPLGGTLTIDLSLDWPGPCGRVRLSRPLVDRSQPWQRTIKGTAWHDDLGGMGAGFAAALGGRLVSALGSESDAVSRDVAARLEEAGIDHHPIRVPDRPADWTLLVSSAGFGDKLAIGFRGCHAALRSLNPFCHHRADLVVIAGLPNRLAAEVLESTDAPVRLLAPSLRSILDRDPPIASIADRISILCCNRREWEQLSARDVVQERVAIITVTEGPRGSCIHFRNPSGGAEAARIDAFPRDRPPQDTNRAGEAFAATLVSSLMDRGWRGGPIERDLLRAAARRASAASALVLDRAEFGFPTPAEIDRTLANGLAR
jgi:ribokinase